LGIPEKEGKQFKKKVKLASPETGYMEEKEMSVDEKYLRISELERQLSIEKMHVESPEKRIEIAERELKTREFDVRKRKKRTGKEIRYSYLYSLKIK
jgi:hypothetical protein